MGRLIDLTGKKIGRITILYRDISNNKKFVSWCCICDCGSTTTVYSHLLIQGKTKSCGCLKFDAKKTHGHASNGTTSSEYRVWAAMIHRCTNKNDKGYKNYGGRGISVCDRWKSFELFIQDMGFRPSSKHSIDRIEVNGNYEPDNCKWATKIEQSRNKRVNNKFGVPGVYWNKSRKKFTASITDNYKSIGLGRFDSLEDAIQARKEAELKYWGKSS